MTVKDWLSRAMNTEHEIRQLTAERDAAFIKATSSAYAMSNDKVQTSKHNISEEKFVSYALYSELLDKRIDDLYKIKTEIMQVINSVDDSLLRAVLIARYIRFKPWEEITNEMNYTYRHIMRLHVRALEAVRGILEKN